MKKTGTPVSNIDYHLVKEIQEKADIVGVISNYIKLVPKGNNYVGLCPFHADNDPSLTVSPQKKIWKCFSCGEKGSVFTFVEKYKNIPFIQAVKEVAELSGFDANEINKISSSLIIDLKLQRLYDLNTLVSQWYEGFLKNPENLPIRDYLQARKILPELVTKFEIGFAPKDGNIIYQMVTNANNMFGEHQDKSSIWTQDELLDVGLIRISDQGQINDFFVNRIMIPIKDATGQIVGFAGRSLNNNDSVKYLNTGTTKIFNKAEVLFNFFSLKKTKPTRIYIVEGYMDVISMCSIGYDNVVGLMGTTLNNKHIELLKSIPSLQTVVLCLDNDEAGLKATFDNAYKLLNEKVNTYVVNLNSQSSKDIDEIIHQQPIDETKKILENIQDFISYKINIIFNKNLKIDEIQAKVHEIFNDMLARGDHLLKTTHLNLLAQLTGLTYKDLEAEYEQLIEINNKLTRRPPSRQSQNDYLTKFEEQDSTGLIEGNVKKSTDFLMIENCQKTLKASVIILENAINELILMMLSNNKYIDDYLTHINIQALSGFVNQITIIKMIVHLYTIKNIQVTQENLLEALNSKAAVEKYQAALEFANKLIKQTNNQEIFKIINAKYKMEKFEQLWKKIKDHQYNYLLFLKILSLHNLDPNLDSVAFDAYLKDLLHFKDLYLKNLKKT